MAILRKTTKTMQQAMDESPTLARLMRMAGESAARLAVIRPVLPAALRQAVRAGPVEEDGAWCLLVANAAAAAKLRQLVPALLAALRSQGHAVEGIRLRIQHPGDRP